MLKIPFDSLTLMAVAHEIGRSIVGGHIQRVTQPQSMELALGIRTQGANHALLFSAETAFARAHLTAIKRANPPEPPAFCMMCRKHLEGGVVTSVDQREFDRILDVRVETAGRPVTLVAELMGKHSNLILVSESGMVLDAMKRISRKQNRFRETLPGMPYIPPPPPAGKSSPFEAVEEDLAELESLGLGDAEALAARIAGRFTGISPFLAVELALRARQTSIREAWGEIFGAAADRRWMPVLVRGDDNRPVGAYPFPTVQAPAEHQNERDSINTALDHYYGSALPRAELDSALHALTTAIERALRARETKRESLMRSLQEVGRADEYRKTGEILLANLHRIEPSAESVSLEDYYETDATVRTIPLDVTKSAKENAEAYFRRYRKSRDAADHHREMLKQTEIDIAALRMSADSIHDAIELKDVAAIRNELSSVGLLRDESARATQDRKRDVFQGKKIRAIMTPEGWEILIGENSEANDFLTTRIAGPNDLWFHVRSTTSAHVVIRTRNDPARVPQSVIKRAAVMAARHSSAKHSATVPVDYMLKKHVRRPRGAASGTVLYKNEKTIHVSPKED